MENRDYIDISNLKSGAEILLPVRDQYDETSLWLFWEVTDGTQLKFKDYLKKTLDGKVSEILKWDLMRVDDLDYLIYIKYWGNEGSFNKTFYLTKIDKDRRLKILFEKTVGFDHLSKNRKELMYSLDNKIIELTETVYAGILSSDNEIIDLKKEKIDLTNFIKKDD